MLFMASWAHAKKFDRTEIIAQVIRKSRDKDVDPSLALAFVEQESNFKPDALRKENKLHTTSRGLFQILVTTARGEFGFQGQDEGLFDIDTNLEIGLDYIKRCQATLGDSLHKTACCFRAGFYVKEIVCQSSRTIAVYSKNLASSQKLWIEYLDRNKI